MSGIGQRLKQERLRLKLSQSALGAIGGVETNAQGNYENGVRSPRADYLSRVAEVGVDVAYVVTGMSLSAGTLSLGADGFSPKDSQTWLNPGAERVAKVISRLHMNLHDMTDNLYQLTQLAQSRVDDDKIAQQQSQLESIQNDAESLAVAIMRLIFVTSRLS
ncbi:helix-turn-helix domain-containing protein [Pseudomonas sp. Pseusp122]|uniref:helix-turn-helix domain-containing protein n=1 Tax=unclassified Pseudomonas TaxID=196821 RepID=UPI0039A691D9